MLCGTFTPIFCCGFLQYIKYCYEIAPHLDAKYTRKSFLLNDAVLPKRKTAALCGCFFVRVRTRGFDGGARICYTGTIQIREARDMQAKRVWAMYWSATDTTKRVVTAIAGQAAQALGVPLSEYDFTLPGARQGAPEFTADDLVVFGTPTYAGRVPNVLLKYLATVQGNGAAAVSVVTFGNRAFDDSLIELRDILSDNGFVPFAAAAFVGEHSFSTTLAAGRPDADDLALAMQFGRDIAARAAAVTAETPVIDVPGRARDERTYYQPRDRAGNPVDIRKVKPKTNDACDDCGLCAKLCPMGSIDPADVRNYIGICIKCGACIKKCPKGAKFYDDPGYLYHKTELEEGYKRRAAVSLFL